LGMSHHPPKMAVGFFCHLDPSGYFT
jgi:hypothetical protein